MDWPAYPEVPALQIIIHTTGLSLVAWGLVIAYCCGTILIIELVKFLLKKHH